ncbi:hypothetical protein [Streptomyces flavidovirens]|uniref:hypothetical protein n=1 Tax=Streptomyces flavidovirens TaxID=67298 RepID=UPI000402F4BC|nr:hypothetical protein [Streptomyces flavidovirens]
MRSSGRPWLRVLGWALFIVGMTMFFINAEALMNSNAVECDGSPMRPGQWCMRVGGESFSYDEEKKNEARGELVGYAGVGLGTLGIVVFISDGITTRRENRKR